MIFPPTSGDRGITVFLDAGHGGLDPGASARRSRETQIEESHINLPIELDALALLRGKGFQVVVSRTEDTTVIKLGSGDTDGQLLTLQGSHDDVAARDVCANKSNANLLVGIYMDAGSSAQNAGSVATYDTSRSFSSANLKFATLLQNDVLGAMNHQGWNIPNDGVVSDATEGSAVGDPADGGLAAESANYNHLLLLGPASSGFFSTPSAMPGAVIEPLFLTDPFEDSIAANAADQKIVADGIAKAVAQYFAPAKKAGLQLRTLINARSRERVPVSIGWRHGGVHFDRSHDRCRFNMRQSLQGADLPGDELVEQPITIAAHRSDQVG